MPLINPHQHVGCLRILVPITFELKGLNPSSCSGLRVLHPTCSFGGCRKVSALFEGLVLGGSSAPSHVFENGIQRIQPRFKLLVSRLSMYQFVDSCFANHSSRSRARGGWPTHHIYCIFCGSASRNHPCFQVYYLSLCFAS